MRCVDGEEFSRLLQRGGVDSAIATIPASRGELLAEVTAAGIRAVNMLHDCHSVLPSVLSDEAVANGPSCRAGAWLHVADACISTAVR